jgi:Ca2+-binding EF-hand superfamily protein
VTDVKLSTHIFMVADDKNNGSLDVRELIANIVFWLRGDLSHKFSIYFTVYGSYKEGNFISEEQLQQPLIKTMKNYKEQFYATTRACDTINTCLDGKITFEEYRNFCLYNP